MIAREYQSAPRIAGSQNTIAQVGRHPSGYGGNPPPGKGAFMRNALARRAFTIFVSLAEPQSGM